MVELLGYIGMFFILISFLFKKSYTLRVMNSIGGFFSCCYGIFIEAWPTVILNLVCLCINTYYIIREIDNKKEINK